MSDGLAYRHDYHEQQPSVEYGLIHFKSSTLNLHKAFTNGKS